MDFIERLFHLFPDGGSGFTELLLLLTPVIVLAALAIWRLRSRTPRS
jgi:hypothetical protein